MRKIILFTFLIFCVAGSANAGDFVTGYATFVNGLTEGEADWRYPYILDCEKDIMVYMQAYKKYSSGFDDNQRQLLDDLNNKVIAMLKEVPGTK